jgi:hypothetical protein
MSKQNAERLMSLRKSRREVAAEIRRIDKTIEQLRKDYNQ